MQFQNHLKIDKNKRQYSDLQRKCRGQEIYDNSITESSKIESKQSIKKEKGKENQKLKKPGL